ncbi:MAG: glycosyltransferase family 2 protein [Eubacteriales bacterium]|nr:glycosyltransferase family 2 protein [Eubacteriales bacterium]
MKVLVIIPAFNEENSIAGVIADIKENIPEADILVVNDGSADRTSIIARSLHVAVADLPFNLGIGGAMQTGYLYARESGYDAAVQVDGDGQHSAACIKALLRELIGGKADLAIGSRYLEQSGYRSSIFRRFGGLFFSFLIRSLTGQRVKDTTSGFRAANRKAIKYFSEHYPTDYPEVESIVKLHKNKMRIKEIPVKMQVRKAGKSSITPLRSLYYMIKVSLSLFIDTMRVERSTARE